MGKTAKKIYYPHAKVKLKSAPSLVLKAPVRVAGSLQTAAAQKNPSHLGIPALPAPHIAEIAALNEKIVLAHKSLECRLRLCESAMSENATLKEKLELQTNNLHQTKLIHQNEMIEVKKTAFLEGQGSIVSELKNLMTSKEFAAELMWGKHQNVS